MAKYTIELRNVCDFYGREEVENWFKNYELSDFLTSSQIEVINESGIWSKEKLAKKIVNHYFMREIGLETPALFKHYAELTMNELMEQYLPLIYSKCIDYNPLESVNFHITETRDITGDSNSNNNGEVTTNSNGKTSGTSDSTSNNKSSNFNVNSDTPQTNINKQNLLNGSYATTTSASDNESNITDKTSASSQSDAKSSQNSNSNSTTNTKSKEILQHHEQGNKGVLDSYQKQIMMFRETIIAFDKEIIQKLNPLFMRFILERSFI